MSISTVLESRRLRRAYNRRYEEPKRRSGRADIQGLRALAVIAVVVNHLTGHPKGGFVGVDVFFVISGYLITGLLLREHDRTGRISYLGFYVRRFKRIIPAAVIVLLSTVIAAHALTPGTRYVAALNDARWSLLFSANWHFGLQGTDYFQRGQEPSPFQHFWSLGVEEQFYVVWPWLMLAVLLVAAKRWRRPVVAVVVAGLSVASFLYAVRDSHVNPSWAYFSSFSRAWELGVGALVAVLTPWLAIRLTAVRAALAWIGVAGAVASLFLVDQAHGFPAPGAALPVLCTALIIAAGIGGPSLVWPLTNPLSRYIGDVSYSLYLWHFPVVVLMVALEPKGSAAYYAWSVSAMGVLSVASYHLIENPIRESNWLADRHGRWRANIPPTAWAAVVASCLLLASLLTVNLADTATQRITRAQSQIGQIGQIQQAGAPLAPCFGAADIDKKGCSPQLGTDIFPTPAEVLRDTAGQYNCFAAAHKPMQTCAFGDTASSAKAIALVGDSHAAMLIPGLDIGAQTDGLRLDTYVGEGCVIGWPIGCDSMPQILHALTSGHYAAIVIAGFRGSLPLGNAPPAGMTDAFRSLQQSGAKLIVMDDVPRYPASTEECTQRGALSITRPCITALSAAIWPTNPLDTAAQETPGAHLLSLRKYFCTPTGCPAVIGNVLVYRDTVSHITATYSRTLGPVFADAISHDLR